MSHATRGTLIAAIALASVVGMSAVASGTPHTAQSTPVTLHTSGPVIDDPHLPPPSSPTTPAQDDPNVIPIPTESEEEPAPDNTPPTEGTGSPSSPSHGLPSDNDNTVPDPLPNPEWPVR